jgi:hypothetical protein
MTDFKAMMTANPIEAGAMRQEFIDAAWADFGRTVHTNMIDSNFVEALTRAGLKCTSTRQMANMLRAYLQTGTLP